MEQREQQQREQQQREQQQREQQQQQQQTQQQQPEPPTKQAPAPLPSSTLAASDPWAQSDPWGGGSATARSEPRIEQAKSETPIAPTSAREPSGELPSVAPAAFAGNIPQTLQSAEEECTSSCASTRREIDLSSRPTTATSSQPVNTRPTTATSSQPINMSFSSDAPLQSQSGGMPMSPSVSVTMNDSGSGLAQQSASFSPKHIDNSGGMNSMGCAPGMNSMGGMGGMAGMGTMGSMTSLGSMNSGMGGLSGSEMMFAAALRSMNGMTNQFGPQSQLVLLLPAELIQRALIPQGHIAEIAQRCGIRVDLGGEVHPDLLQVGLTGSIVANAMASYFLQERVQQYASM